MKMCNLLAPLTMLAVFVGRIVQISGFDNLVDKTIRVYPGYFHATSGFGASVISDTTTGNGRFFVTSLQRGFAAIQRTRLDATQHGRGLRRRYGRAARRQTANTNTENAQLKNHYFNSNKHLL